jgi:hypothetical protein
MRMRVLLTALLAAALPGTLAAQQEQQTIEFSGRTWAVFGEEVKAETHLGQEAVRLRNGALVLTDSEFENGTIEFDVASSGHRSFVGAAFRIAGGTGDYEDFYLRPHQTGRLAALPRAQRDARHPRRSVGTREAGSLGHAARGLLR